MSDLFGAPEGKRNDRDEYRLIVNNSVIGGLHGYYNSREAAELAATNYSSWVRWHIEHRTVTTYTTPWKETS